MVATCPGTSTPLRPRNRPGIVLAFALAAAVAPPVAFGQASSAELLIQRLDKLDRENHQLREEVEALKAEMTARRPATSHPPAAPAKPDATAGTVRTDSGLGYAILDPTTRINRKQRLVLERKRAGVLAPDALHLHGAVTAIANFQTSNKEDKFGYLMRHPTATNQVGDSVSEAAIHSAQLGFTGTLNDWITGHAVALFEPEQSFGGGTNTSIERNQLQMRRAWVLLGNLNRSPFFVSLGKMNVPFGLTDTVNPFTASTVWHAFGALANGVTAGYASEGPNFSIIGIQGGAQFRGANAPVKGTAVPGKLNNFAVDAHYDIGLGPAGSFLIGGSYLHATAYCQDFPVKHFEACRDNNPAFGVYGRYAGGGFTLKGEFIRTTKEWPGTFNPDIPQFGASKVTSFDVGAKYRFDRENGPLDVSAEFSRFVAGPRGAPWHRQNQFVVGAAWFVHPGAKLFAEYIRIAGFAPLNFISGGSIRDNEGEVVPDRTISDASARSNIFLLGANVVF